jgi:type I restriction enzyme S subunit
MITEKFNDLFYFARKSKIKAGEGLKEGLYPFYTSSPTLSKRIDVFQEDRISLIFGTGGKASIHYVSEQFSTSTDCIVALKKEDKEFNEKFAFYYLIGNIHILERGFKGAGLKHISKKYIQNLDIPILPIDSQNKIVALLDKASTLVQKREKGIDLLDELLRAKFLEMFGDPVLNPKEWDFKPIKKHCKVVTGNTPPRNKKEYYNEKFIEWIKTDNIKYNNPNPTVAKEYLSELGLTKGRSLSSGDLLVACIAGSLSSIGRVSICDRDVAFNQQINGIKVLENYNSYFLYSLIYYSGKYIQSFATKGMKRIITKGVFEKIKFIIPPIELQNQFETIYHNIQSQKETLSQSKTELEHFYNSILQEAFKGEIEVSKEDVKKKELIMPEIKKKEGEKVDITSLDLATYLGIPDEITSTREKWMFDLINLDEFYQFSLKDNFTKEETFTLQDIEEKLWRDYYHDGDIDFDNAKWQDIIFAFLKAKPPLLVQIFDKETASVKLKLTDETFKA